MPGQGPTWPCRNCGSRVALDLMTCSACGTPFLPHEPALAVPGVGDPRGMSTGMKIAIMSGGSLAVTAVVFVVFLAFGALF